MLKSIVFAVLAFAGTAQAATTSITLMKDFALTKTDGRETYASIFIEEATGKRSENTLAHGCELHGYSEKGLKVLPAGNYPVSRDEITRPSVWDRRWWRNISSEGQNYELWISCKSRRSIQLNKINQLLRVYAQAR